MARIIDYTADTVPASTDYLIVDSSAEGTRKIAVSDLMEDTPIKNSTKALSSNGAYNLKEKLESSFGVTKNLFNVESLTYAQVTVTDGIVIAKANVLNSGYKNGFFFPSVAENVQYTISGKVKTDAESVTTGIGLCIIAVYSDSSTDRVNFYNTYTSYTEFSFTTAVGKTLSYFRFSYSSGGDNLWYLDKLQIEKASSKTDYVPYKTAVDYMARDKQNTGKRFIISFLGYSSYLGNAIPIVFDDGTVFMIDSFSESAWSAVQSDLSERGITHIDYFMLTHWHEDHCGNMLNLIENEYIDSDTIVYLPQALDTTASTSLPSDWDTVVSAESTITRALTEAGITPVRPSEGDTVKIDNCVFDFWNTDHSVFYYGATYPSRNYNDWSLCAYLTCGNTVICFTGDIGPIGQQKMADLGTMRKANVMTSPHHGWTNGTYTNGYGIVPEFINAVSPDVVITEDFSTHDRYIDTIKSPIQTWCQKNGIGHYRTYINGSMDMKIGTDGWSFLGAYKQYITNGSDWNWYDYERELMIDAQIKSASYRYDKKCYAYTASGTTGAGILHNAVTNIAGNDDGTVSYDFRVRVLDDGDSDAFCEMIISGYVYQTTTPTMEYIRNRKMVLSAKNNQGTLVMDGVTGNAIFVIEIMGATAV